MTPCMLYAGGNVPTALSAAMHHPLLSNQPSMGYAGDKFQAGLEALDVLEVTVSRLVADAMGAEFAEVRPTSATLANLAVYAAVAQPGDTIAVLPGWAGGHLSHHEIGAAGHPRPARRRAAVRPPPARRRSRPRRRAPRGRAAQARGSSGQA